MEINDLIVKVRELVGDVEHEGNTTKFTEAQVVDALNLAQGQLAEITGATYQESDSTVNDLGIVDFLDPEAISDAGVMSVQRVICEDAFADPDGTITGVSTFALAASPITLSVPLQTGAEYLWSVAGGVVDSGGATNEATISATNAGALFVSCAVSLHGKVTRGEKTITVTAT